MRSIGLIRGKVVAGAKRGKSLGFPTANIAPSKRLPEGIYVAIVVLDRREYQAVAFIGCAKTFGEKDYKAEAYILDFTGNIYGRWLTIKLLKRLRGNQKFSSANKLVEQMKKDILGAREFFGRRL